MSGLNEILNNGKGTFSQDKLMAYLEGRLSPEEQHDVELWLAEEGIESDALEGLKDIPPEETKKVLSKLNYGLKRQLSGKSKRRKKLLEPNAVGWLAIIVILILCVVAYVLFRYAIHK